MVDGGRGVPPGMSAFLRAATVERSGTTVRVALPPAAAERIRSRPDERRTLEESLAAALGADVTLEWVTEEAEGVSRGGDRITRDAVRESRLQELLRQEPALAHAVEELDLELLDGR